LKALPLSLSLVKNFFARRGWWDGQTQQQSFFSETFFSRGPDGGTDRLNSKTKLGNIFSVPQRFDFCTGLIFFYGQTQQQCFFSETFFSRGANGQTQQQKYFSETFFSRGADGNGQTQQQCFFAETFFSRGANKFLDDGQTQQQCFFSETFFSRGANIFLLWMV
jgi:hypothetical protein